MKKVKVEEISGAALDWAVATVRGRPGLAQMILLRPESYTYRPSTNGGLSMDIIEDEKIGIDSPGYNNVEPERGWSACIVDWATCAVTLEDPVEAWGPTPLVAAMRCFVKSKCGDEIEVPKELV